MKEQLFEREDKNYNDIKIPESLDFRVRQSLKIAKRKERNFKLIKVSTVAACFLIAFITLVNVSPNIAKAFYSIPGLKGFVSWLSLDKGFMNAIEKESYQNIYYEDEKNGVKFTINSIVGDKNHMWISYDLHGKEDLRAIDLTIIDSSTNKVIPAPVLFFFGDTNKEKHFEVIMPSDINYSNNIKLVCDVSKNGLAADNKSIVASFEVPITLDSNILNANFSNIPIKNRILSTAIGEISFDELNTSTTITNLEYSYSNEEFIFEGFFNARLEDSEGNVYNSSMLGYSSTGTTKKILSFQGEIKNSSKDLTFKCDGIYYTYSKQASIVVDLKNKKLDSKGLDLELVKLENNKLTLKAYNMSDVKIKPMGNYDMEASYHLELTDKSQPYALINLNLENFKEEKLELTLSWFVDTPITTGPYSIKLN